MEITAVYCERHMKHINTVLGQNYGFLNVEAGSTYNYHFGFQFNKRSLTLCGNRSAKNIQPLLRWFFFCNVK
jgi:hypothetical protein